MSRAEKDAALLHLADAVEAATPTVIAANAEDLERGRARGMSESLQDRLRLDERRVAAVAQALRDVAALPDPVGEIVRGSTLANGLQIRQVRVPMGVIGMIYEARPNVTVDAAGLCLKSGNAVILRGGLSSRQQQPRPRRGDARIACGTRTSGRGHHPARGGWPRCRPRPHDRPWPRRPRHPARRGRPHPDRRHRVDRARHRDRRRGLPRLRRPRRRPRQGAGDHAQRQDAPAQRLQRRRVAPRPPRRRRRLPAQGADRPRRRGGATARGTRGDATTPRRRGRHTTSPASRTSARSGTVSR